MANDVYATLKFHGDKLDEFKADLERIKDESETGEITLEDLHAFYNYDEEERTYIDYIEIFDDYVEVYTWNAWAPYLEFWYGVVDFYDQDDGQLEMDCFAQDNDNPFNLLSFTWSGRDAVRYALFYYTQDDVDEFGITDEEFENDNYYCQSRLLGNNVMLYNTLDEVDVELTENALNWALIEIYDEEDAFGDDPRFVDLDGNETSDPRYNLDD